MYTTERSPLTNLVYLHFTCMICSKCRHQNKKIGSGWSLQFHLVLKQYHITMLTTATVLTVAQWQWLDKSQQNKYYKNQSHTFCFSSVFSSLNFSTFCRRSVTSSFSASTSAVSGPLEPRCCRRKLQIAVKAVIGNSLSLQLMQKGELQPKVPCGYTEFWPLPWGCWG